MISRNDIMAHTFRYSMYIYNCTAMVIDETPYNIQIAMHNSDLKHHDML